MKIEKAQITIDHESQTFFSIPIRHVLFFDCKFKIDIQEEEAIIFINCYFENCSFNNIDIIELNNKSIGGCIRGCTFEDKRQ